MTQKIISLLKCTFYQLSKEMLLINVYLLFRNTRAFFVNLVRNWNILISSNFLNFFFLNFLPTFLAENIVQQKVLWLKKFPRTSLCESSIDFVLQLILPALHYILPFKNLVLIKLKQAWKYFSYLWPQNKLELILFFVCQYKFIRVILISEVQKPKTGQKTFYMRGFLIHSIQICEP